MKVKLCGNHSLEDLIASSSSNAAYIGFVFARSKRQVVPKEVRSWLQQVTLKPNQQKVGVFVNAQLDEIREAVDSASLDVVQLHGTESPEEAAQIKRLFPVEVWKVIHHHEHALELLDQYKDIVDGFLIDKKSAKAWGGTGESFDWTFVPKYLSKAHAHGKPCFIAGGVNVENVLSLLKYQPNGIDLASGVETNFRKDKHKITQLQECVETYERYFTK